MADPQDLEPEVQTPPVGGAPAATPAEDIDPDLRELQEAQAEIDAEEKGEQPPADQTPPSPTPTAAAPPAAPQQPIMVPKARLDEETGKRRKAEEDAAYLRGQVDAYAKMGAQPGQPGGNGAPAPQAPVRTADDVEADLVGLAEKYDNGELTMKQYREQSNALDREMHTFRVKELTADRAPPNGHDNDAPPRRVPDSHVAVPEPGTSLEDRTAQVWQQYPILDWMNERYGDGLVARLKALEPGAQDAVEILLEQQGRVFNPRDPNHTLMLRREVAKLAESAYGRFAPETVAEGTKRRTTNGAAPRPSPAAAPTTKPAQTPVAAAVARAQAMPPDVRSLAREPEQGTGEITEAAIEQMDDDAINALPKAVRDRLMMGTG